MKVRVKVAIQCRDARTDQVGTYGYHDWCKLPGWNPRPYSVTPVFPSLTSLIEYCDANNIERVYTDNNS